MDSFQIIKEEIIETCRMFAQKEYFIGTWGNVSVRKNDVILLTPSRVDYNKMVPEDIVMIDLAGNIVGERQNPTSEKEVHRQIYNAREDIGAVIHSHSVYATAAACIGHDIPPMFEEMSQLLGGKIYCAEKYVPAEHHYELGEIAAATVRDKNALLLKNHGPVACGRDLNEAVLSTFVLEKAAKIYMSIVKGAQPAVIEDEYVKSERYRYQYKYGNEKV